MWHRIHIYLAESHKLEVPACFRCNVMKSNMPHAAWIRIAEIVKIVRKEGLFGDWKGAGHGNHIENKQKPRN